MPTLTLTDIAVRNLKPSARRITYSDANLKGFGVRIAPSGTKTFTLMYGPTRKRISLGRVGVVSLADARKEAKRILAEHTLGQDGSQAITYQKALDEFLDESGRINKPRTTHEYKRLLNTHFRFGKTPLADVTQLEIKQRLAKLNSKVSEKRHALVAIKRLMRWAIANQYITRNPVEGLSAPPQKSRDRVLTLIELKCIFSAALEQRTMFDSIVALLVLTGQRRGEIASLEWDWIENDQISIPETKNGRLHRFPLGEKAKAVIENIPRTSDTFLFPARTAHMGGNPSTVFNGWSKSKARFDEQLEKVAPYTLHDIRRTFSSTLAQIGTPIHVTEKLLNHVSGTHSGVQGIYNRYSYMDEMREAIDLYEDWLPNLS